MQRVSDLRAGIAANGSCLLRQMTTQDIAWQQDGLSVLIVCGKVFEYPCAKWEFVKGCNILYTSGQVMQPWAWDDWYKCQTGGRHNLHYMTQNYADSVLGGWQGSKTILSQPLKMNLLHEGNTMIYKYEYGLALLGVLSLSAPSQGERLFCSAVICPLCACPCNGATW